MSAIDNHVEVPRLRSRTFWLRAVGANLAADISTRYARARERRRRIRQIDRLLDLEDWQLDDMGLFRGDLDYERQKLL